MNHEQRERPTNIFIIFWTAFVVVFFYVLKWYVLNIFVSHSCRCVYYSTVVCCCHRTDVLYDVLCCWAISNRRIGSVVAVILVLCICAHIHLTFTWVTLMLWITDSLRSIVYTTISNVVPDVFALSYDVHVKENARAVSV